MVAIVALNLVVLIAVGVGCWFSGFAKGKEVGMNEEASKYKKKIKIAQKETVVE